MWDLEIPMLSRIDLTNGASGPYIEPFAPGWEKRMDDLLNPI